MKSDRELLQVLCPFGEWPHAKGMQVVDEESARKMKRAAAWSAAVGIPIYVGHPDDEGIRAKAVGRIKRICPTNDGIAVVAAYPQKTYEKIVRGDFSAMSPRWRMQKLGDGRYRPVKLLSVGLTNNPNISESGKILGFGGRGLAQTAERSRAAMAKMGKLAEEIEICAEKAESLRKSAAAATISERLAARKNADERPERRLAELALERSRRLGEPYTKSFAAVKKQKLNG